MGKKVITPRAYALAEMTNSNELLIQKNMRLMVDKAVESGLYLIELKDELPHGEFMSFCAEHVRVKRSQIDNYMKAAKADPSLLIEYKESDQSSGGLAGFLKKLKDAKPSPSGGKLPVSGNLEEDQSLEDPEEPDTWTEDELIEDSNNSTIERTIYGVEDLEKLTANVLHAGMLLDSIIEHVDITPDEFAHHLSKEITHDGENPRSAAVVAEYTAKVQMFMDLIVSTRGLLDTKPNLKVV